MDGLVLFTIKSFLEEERCFGGGQRPKGAGRRHPLFTLSQETAIRPLCSAAYGEVKVVYAPKIGAYR